MYTSDIEKKHSAAKTSFVYLLISVFCAMFGGVYETYSHEVYSYYMIYAFAFPLVGGALPFAAISLSRAKHYPGAIARNLYHAGIATMTVGSIIQGVLEIYGTTNELTKYYSIAAMCLCAFAIICFLSQIVCLYLTKP